MLHVGVCVMFVIVELLCDGIALCCVGVFAQCLWLVFVLLLLLLGYSMIVVCCVVLVFLPSVCCWCCCACC